MASSGLETDAPVLRAVQGVQIRARKPQCDRRRLARTDLHALRTPAEGRRRVSRRLHLTIPHSPRLLLSCSTAKEALRPASAAHA